MYVLTILSRILCIFPFWSARNMFARISGTLVPTAPFWLKDSTSPVLLYTGPPCNCIGKSSPSTTSVDWWSPVAVILVEYFFFSSCRTRAPLVRRSTSSELSLCGGWNPHVWKLSLWLWELSHLPPSWLGELSHGLCSVPVLQESLCDFPPSEDLTFFSMPLRRLDFLCFLWKVSRFSPDSRELAGLLSWAFITWEANESFNFIFITK